MEQNEVVLMLVLSAESSHSMASLMLSIDVKGCAGEIGVGVLLSS
jgi:hypothetical protein